MASTRQTNGLLPVTASQTSGTPSKPAASKGPTSKLKVIIRRLPPCLTEEEFTTILGDEWKVGQGKVDWFLYKSGKDSKDPSKPSRPARAYLHLTNETHLLNLSEVVRRSSFEDALNTFMNPCLIGPPSVEFAPYGRTPGGRRRVDARAGTIDQDPEFMAFLEGLANPTTSRENNGDLPAEGAPSKNEKVTTTPLVQFLKDKKASKNKDAASKAAKKHESTKGKSAKDTSTAEDAKKRGKDTKADKGVERATKEAVKILNREAASKSAPSTATPAGSENVAPPKLDVTKVPNRQKSAVIAAHLRMLQRDLGLSPAQAHRQVRRDTADALKAEKAAAAAKGTSDTKESSASHAETVPNAPKGGSAQSNSRRSRAKGLSSETENNKSSSPTTTSPAAATTSAPMILLKKPVEAQQSATASPTAQPAKAAPTTIARKPQAAAIPSEGATQAFVKHANPSQGVTEPLLKEAMEKYGAVSMVEIDRRKGFAYVDFADTEGLKKAMAANPIPVAQGTVHVMQRKGTALPPEKKPVNQAPHGPSRGGRGGRGGTVGRRGGRGGARGGAKTATGASENPKPPSSAPTGPAVK